MSKIDNEIKELNEDYNMWAGRKVNAEEKYKRFKKLCDRNMDVLKKRISNLSKKDD